MNFKFNNYALRTGRRGNDDWFEWKVYMDEPPEILNKIKRVEYRLHDTFPQPIRVVEDRRSRFALQSNGWGIFTIYITIYLNDGTEEYTTYLLSFDKSPGDIVVRK